MLGRMKARNLGTDFVVYPSDLSRIVRGDKKQIQNILTGMLVNARA